MGTRDACGLDCNETGANMHDHRHAALSFAFDFALAHTCTLGLGREPQSEAAVSLSLYQWGWSLPAAGSKGDMRRVRGMSAVDQKAQSDLYAMGCRTLTDYQPARDTEDSEDE